MDADQWKDRLKAKVEGEGPLPAPGVSWNALEEGIQGIERRRMAWRWAGAVAAVAAVSAGIALVLPWRRPDPDVPSSIIAETAPMAVDVVEDVVEIVEDSPKQVSLLAMAGVDPLRNASLEQPKEVYAPKTLVDSDAETVPEECNDLAGPQEADKPSEKVTVSEKKSDGGSSFGGNTLWDELERENASKSKHGRLSIGVGSGFTAGSNMDNDYAAPPMDSPGGILADPTNPFPPSKESITLDFPVSFGVSARYAFSERLFILGGLSATTFSAESSENPDGGQLWYLGPSAGLGVNLYQNAGLSVYSAATGKLGWCLNRGDLPMLPSIDLSAGVQLRLGGKTYLYAEPQLRYSFRSENSTAKVSLQTPVQFVLGVGLRFDL